MVPEIENHRSKTQDEGTIGMPIDSVKQKVQNSSWKIWYLLSLVMFYIHHFTKNLNSKIIAKHGGDVSI